MNDLKAEYIKRLRATGFSSWKMANNRRLHLQKIGTPREDLEKLAEAYAKYKKTTVEKLSEPETPKVELPANVKKRVEKYRRMRMLELGKRVTTKDAVVELLNASLDKCQPPTRFEESFRSMMERLEKLERSVYA